MSEIISEGHAEYEHILSVWEKDRCPRRVIVGGAEYSAVQDSGLKFVPVQATQGFSPAYDSTMQDTAEKKTKRRNTRKKNELEETPEE